MTEGGTTLRRRRPEAVVVALEGWLPKFLGVESVSVHDLVAPEGSGFSNETYLFTAAWDGGSAPLVVQAAPVGPALFHDYDLAAVSRVQRRLAEVSEVPVAPVRGYEGDPAVLEAPFYVMDRVAGRVPTDSPPYHASGWFSELPAKARRRAWWSGIEAMARLHALDIDADGFGFLFGTPWGIRRHEDPAARRIAMWREFLTWAAEDPLPLASAGLDALEATRPAPPPRLTVHWGDAKLSNCMLAERGVAALFDWELCGTSDPEEDLAHWLMLDWYSSTSADPYWTETCWFSFAAPERRLSGQLYPFFRPNQRVTAGGAYFWDDRGGDQTWSCLYAKNFWHLPMPDQPLTDLSLPNGIRYRCVEPLTRYELRYDDPDGGDEVHVELSFTALLPPHYLGASHLDQPGRYRGTIVLRGEEIPVDAYGLRDRSWGPRTQFGQGLTGSPARSGGYSYATASERDAFHTITMDFGSGCISIHGYLLRDGQWSKLASGRREVLERDKATGYPLRVAIDGVDERGRTLHAEGRCLNKLGLFLNPNLFTVNCLTEWTFGGVTAFGEDHDNWSAPAARRFFRAQLGYDPR